MLFQWKLKLIKVLQSKKTEQKEEETQTNYHGQEITVPIMTGDFKKLEINPEGKKRVKFNFQIWKKQQKY